METQQTPTWEVQQTREGIIAEAELEDDYCSNPYCLTKGCTGKCETADENQKDCDGEIDFELQEMRQREQDEDVKQEFFESWGKN